MTAADFSALLDALLTRHAAIEAGLLLACLGLAWLLVRALGGGREHEGRAAGHESIWFGRHVIDGVLFPVAALVLAAAARWVASAQMPVALLKLAVPVLGSLVVIRIAVRVLRAAFPGSQAVRVVERTVSWGVWIVLVLWLTGLLPVLLAEADDISWKLGGAPVSLRSLIEGAIAAVAVMVAALWISAAIEARLLAGAGAGADGSALSVRKMAAAATRALLLLVGLLLALTAAGIPLGALGVFGGALGVGIGLGLQRLAANYVSGFVILAERSLRIGDTVKVDNFEGRITDIHTRYTVVRALNGRESIVPNDLLVTQRIENASLADPLVAVTTQINVGYGTDVAALMPLLSTAVAAVPRVLAEPAPGVMLTNFGADGIELTVAFWIGDPQAGLNNVRSDVNLALLRCLREQGVEIPFPQRVVHQAGASAEGRR